jgi:hypothetical protein
MGVMLGVGLGITSNRRGPLGVELVTIDGFDKRAGTNGVVTRIAGQSATLTFTAHEDLSLGLSHPVNVIAGRVYRFSGTLHSDAGIAIAQIGTNSGGGGSVISGFLTTTNGDFSIDFGAAITREVHATVKVLNKEMDDVITISNPSFREVLV